MQDIAQSEPTARAAQVQQSEPMVFKSTSPARRVLLKAVCMFYMCDMLHWRGVDRVAIIGKPENALVAMEMANYLVGETVRLSNDYSKAQKERIDFRKGCMSRLALRLNQMRHDRERAGRQANPGNLPALFVSETKQVADFMAGIARLKARKTSYKMGAHAIAGDAAGKNISLAPQVRAGASVKRIAS